ncbi:MAG: CysB family HTH-type transcriptional regulator [Hyphomicrobiaceae bacterium]|nr:CysB family HTH-type transcriptional regulator [Hyphomicrobiaceae bacterium]
MNFQQLRIIRETVRRNFNLTEAAQALLTSQSGVSKTIRDLEQELGVEIFIRRGKRLLGLTEPGHDVTAIADKILLEAENLQQLSRQFAGKDAGALTIATTHTQARYALPRTIAKFKLSFPNVRLTINQASPKEIARVLLEGNADIGIATDALEAHPDIIAFPYYTWEHAIVVPAEHPLLSEGKPTLEAIAEFRIITYDDGLTGRTRIDKAFANAGVVPDIAMSALDADVIKTYVELGLGVGIIASMAFDPERDNGLARVDTDHLFEPSTSSIAIRRGRLFRSYAYQFIELCSPQLTETVVRKAEARR